MAQQVDSPNSRQSELPPGCRAADHSLSDSAIAADVQLLSAVGNDTRYEALRLIAERDDSVCVCELEPALGVSQGAVSQALARLHSAGLVSREKQGRWRYYTATDSATQLLTALDDLPHRNE